MSKFVSTLLGFGPEHKPEPVEGIITPEAMRQLPEAVRKEFGRKAAEAAKWHRMYLELERKQKPGPSPEELAAKRHEELKLEGRVEIIPLGELRKAGVKLLSKDHRLLGTLDDFALIGGENPRLGVLARYDGGKRCLVWSAERIAEIIHRPEGIRDVLEHKTLVLQRDWAGLFSPDMKFEPSAEQIEESIGKATPASPSGGRDDLNQKKTS